MGGAAPPPRDVAGNYYIPYGDTEPANNHTSSQPIVNKTVNNPQDKTKTHNSDSLNNWTGKDGGGGQEDRYKNEVDNAATNHQANKQQEKNKFSIMIKNSINF